MGRPCRYKVRYKDNLGAMIAMSRLKEDRGELRIYKCPQCRGFHMTSQGKRNKRITTSN